MKREELIDEVAKMLKEKHGDPKRGAAATNLTSDTGRRSVAEDVVDLLLQETRIEEVNNELIIDLTDLGGGGGSGSDG